MSTGIWYCYGWESWHYSIDTCQTWVDVPMLDIRVVGGTGSVDTFDWKLWNHESGADLEFFDSRYAQSGWHDMSEFVVEYYDGVGYDGEPLKVVDVAITDEQSDGAVWLNNLTPTGVTPESPSPDATVTGWECWVYGQWSAQLLTSYSVPDAVDGDTPWDQAAGAGSSQEPPLVIVLRSKDLEPALDDAYRQCVNQGAVFKLFDGSVGLQHLVQEVLDICESSGGRKIQLLEFADHGGVDQLKLGQDILTSRNFFEKGRAAMWAKLSAVMSENAQIHFQNCSVAGPYPDHLLAGNPQTYYEREAVYARTMLRTIAKLTGTTVFASSDDNWSKWTRDLGDPKKWKLVDGDLCLEFGVRPDGQQVSSRSASPAAWNLAKVNWFQNVDKTQPHEWSQVPTLASDEGPGFYFLLKAFPFGNLW